VGSTAQATHVDERSCEVLDGSSEQHRDCAMRSTRVRWGRLAREHRFQFDRSYLERLVAGDPGTEDHFTQYFGALLSMKLRLRLRTPALVEDAKQETFLRVFTALRKNGLQSPGALGSFVNSVCNNVVFELYRSHARTTPLEEEAERELPDEAVGAEASLSDAEQRAHVRTIMATLPERERDLLKWLFFDEIDKDEICRRMNVDREYLRVLLYRAKARFRTEYVGG
jgi:RNA polymerase sigma-70 factor (ECF subfamily)